MLLYNSRTIIVGFFPTKFLTDKDKLRQIRRLSTFFAEGPENNKPILNGKRISYDFASENQQKFMNIIY